MTTQGTELPDTIQAIEYFFEQGLTDGLPVVPPTPEAVQAFLEAGGLAPDEVLGHGRAGTGSSPLRRLPSTP